MRLRFPVKGLNENWAFEEQPELTTPECENVMAYESGRARGGQRPGLSKWSTAGTSNPIQDLNYTVQAKAGLDTGDGQFLVRNDASASQDASLLSSDGTEIAAIDLGDDLSNFDGNTGTFDCDLHNVWDSNGICYVTYNKATPGEGRVRAINTSGTTQWDVLVYSGSDKTSPPRGVALDRINEKLYVLEHKSGENMKLHVLLTSDGTVESTVDLGVDWQTFDDPTASGQNEGRENPVRWVGSAVIIGALDEPSSDSYFIFYDTADGSVTTHKHTNSSNATKIDVGDGKVFGYIFGNTLENLESRDPGGTIVFENSETDRDNQDIAYDSLNDRLVAVNSTNLVVYSVTDGSFVSETAHGGSSKPRSIHVDSSGNILIGADSGVIQGYDDQFSQTLDITVGSAEHYSISSINDTFVLGESFSGIRSLTLLGVSAGSIFEFTSTSKNRVAHTVLGPTSKVQSAPLFGTMYFVDGGVYWSYDSANGTAAEWEASSGALPVDANGATARLIALWAGRIVLASVAGDPHNWFMSAVGDALNFDYSPDPTTVTQAIAGNNSDAGKVGDIINALIPFTDDYLVFGGDHSIWKMSGNPASGGRIDEVTEVTGIAYGQAWCRDPTGAVWFFGSRGGLYRMNNPGTTPQRISATTVDERLANIDVVTNEIRMAWDDRLQGVWIFITPSDATSETTHYFYDTRNQAWFPQVLASTDFDPRSILLFDGDDPDDRVLLLGGRDGFVRKLDIDSTDDDGTAISSKVVLGPLEVDDDKDMLVQRLTGSLGSGTVTWGVAKGSSAKAAADNSGSPQSTGTWTSGRNTVAHPRVRGGSAVIKLSATDAWSLEEVTAELKEQGLRRV